MSQSPSKPFGVFTVRESQKKGDKGFWTRIGSAFPHEKGEGFNVLLDALPVDGKLVVLPPKDEATSDGA